MIETLDEIKKDKIKKLLEEKEGIHPILLLEFGNPIEVEKAIKELGYEIVKGQVVRKKSSKK